MAKIFYTTLMKQKNNEPYLRINSFFFFLERFYLIITFCEVHFSQRTENIRIQVLHPQVIAKNLGFSDRALLAVGLGSVHTMGP